MRLRRYASALSTRRKIKRSTAAPHRGKKLILDSENLNDTPGKVQGGLKNACKKNLRTGDFHHEIADEGTEAEIKSFTVMTKRFCDYKTWKEIGEVPRPGEALKSGDYQAALNGFAMEHFIAFRESRTMASDSSLINFGATLWLLGDFYGAAIIWARVCDEAIKGRFTHSSDGTFKGGLLLWFASVWLEKGDWQKKPVVLLDNLHDLADALLEKLLNKKRPRMGAGIYTSIAKHLRGELELEKVASGGQRRATLAGAATNNYHVLCRCASV